MATLEELESQVNELQELVSADYTAPEGPEFSYPAVGQAVDDEMWKFITLALGSGVLDTGGKPYWLEKLGSDSETNQANQMRLTVSSTSKNAQALLNGFYHRLLENMRLDFPMPLSQTTYYVTLELNPLKAKSALGPISVQVYPNELNTESGREHLVLWEVTRKPNQLLTDATIKQVRPKLAPTLTVDTREQLPPVSSLIWGTRFLIHSTREEVMAWGSNQNGKPNSWMEISDPGWSEYPDTPTYKWVGHGYRRAIQRKGKTRRLRGRITPVDGVDFEPTSEAGYLMFSLAEGDRPKQEVRFMTAGPRGTTGRNGCSVTVYANGEVRAWPDRTMSWMGLDGIEFDVE